MRKLVILTLFLFFFLNFQVSFAQNKGITVVPSIAHLDLAVDSPEYELTYINHTGTDVTLLLKATDFTELEEGYKINFLEGKDASNYKYSLSSWISFENRTLQLKEGEKKTIKIFIDKNRITKGGHYASIQAEIVQENQSDKINIRAVISSLLFIRASTGQEIEDGKISLFEPLRDFLDYPDSYILRFNNSGNVHVVPHGVINVYDPFGKLVSKGILNDGSLDALPESIRRYDTKVNSYQKLLLPGFYEAKLSMSFGKTNKKLTSSVRFFSQGSVNLPILGAIILGVIVLLIIVKRSRKKT